MADRTEQFNRNLYDDITVFTGTAAQNGWEPSTPYVAGDDWADFEANLSSGIFGVDNGTSRLHRTTFSMGGAEIVEFEFDFYVDDTGVNWGSDATIVLLNWYLEYFSGSVLEQLALEMNWNTSGQLLTIQALQKTGGGAIQYLFRGTYTYTDIPFSNEHTLKVRFENGKYARVYLNINKSGLWKEFTNKTPTNIMSDVSAVTFNNFWAYIDVSSNEVSHNFTCYHSGIRVYTNTEITIPQQELGMIDKDGNQILGVDADDDGSGTSTLGSGGFGGGGKSDGTNTVVGGRKDGGLVGSGSEGNFSLDGTETQIGTGDASAWAGSGSGINITGYAVSRFLDNYGFGDVYFDIVDNWTFALNAFKGKFFSMQEEGTPLFTGYVDEVHTIGRYKGRFTLKELHYNFNEIECQKNYAQIINTNGYTYDTISVVSTTTITLTNGSTGSLATDNTMGAMIVPSPDNEPSFTDEISSVNTVVLTTGTGSQDNIYDDDNDFVTNALSTAGAAGATVEFTGTYSGTQSEITALELELYVEGNLYVFGETTIKVYIYDYDSAADWEELYELTIAQGFIGYSGKIKLSGDDLKKVNSGTPQNYFDGSDNWKIKLVHSDTNSNNQAKIRLYYADFKVYTDPFYDNSYFPVTGTGDGTQIVSSVDFAAAGVSAGDTVVVGKRNDVVLADIVAAAYFDFAIDTDTNFSDYTASDFGTQKVTIADAIQSVLKKEDGVMYFAYDTGTSAWVLYFRKKSSLSSSGIKFSNTDFFGGTQALIKEVQSKRTDNYAGIEITGNSYKVYDGQADVIHFEPVPNNITNRILRITDTAINSQAEAAGRALSEKQLINTSDEPVFDIEYNVSDEGIPSGLYPGFLAQAQYHGKSYQEMPLRNITFTRIGNEKVRLLIELGWKGTSYADRDADDLNDIRKRLKSLENARRNVPSPILNDVLTQSDLHTVDSNYFNGSFVETFDATVTSDGATITMSLEQSGGGDLTCKFSSGTTTLDCTPAQTIALTAGSDASPQLNYIYILQTDPSTLVKSTASWPATEHIKISYFIVPSATFVQNNGCYGAQNWNNHRMDTVNQGHQSHQDERSRLFGARYFSGINGNGTDGYLTPTASNVEFISTSGVVFQMHKHTFPAIDTSAGDVVLVKNWNGDAYHDITNLFDITADSTGTAIGNNKYFNLVVWGVANKTGEWETVIINLPGGFYNSDATAKADLDGYTDESIPREFSIDSSIGFLICKIRIKMATTWEIQETTDLRGQIGSPAVSTAAAPQVEFADNTFKIYDESDNTKELQFQVSGVTTATTRTKTVQDTNGTLAELTDVSKTAIEALGIQTVGTVTSGVWNATALVDAYISDSIGAGGATKAQLEDLLMFGSGNTAWIPCIPPTDLSLNGFQHTTVIYNPKTTGTCYFFGVLPLPTNKGSLALYIGDVRFRLTDADGSNKVTNVWVWGYNSSGRNTVDSDSTGWSTITLHTVSITTTDVSAYEYIAVQFAGTTNSATALDLTGMEIECYYA